MTSIFVHSAFCAKLDFLASWTKLNFERNGKYQCFEEKAKILLV